MKRLQVYWRHSPEELDVLQVVEHVRFGPDGEEVITTNEGAQTILAMAREFADAFWVEGVSEIDPHVAADLICQQAEGPEAVGLLRRLIALVSQEDQEVAQALFEDFEHRLKAGA